MNEGPAVSEQHATDYRVTRFLGMPFGRIEIAGNQPATVFDHGQG